MKHAEPRPYADPEAAARQLVKLAAGIEPVQDGHIHIEKINAPFLFTLKGRGTEFIAGLRYAVEKGWLELHESGTLVRLLQPGNDLLSH
ncbi:hypothetical protein EDE08_104640 [Bradyrhizobium sp. R2.2-H]|jgi:hypothetical protein|uniref:hypothetical protein n=1 Tax=unclassified Bradyrhizobium TaxID=2631580 RepID=UPI00105040EA|nr:MULTISPECIES: hypothetical protein [unclassified Bradyrhizobium]TCU73348.1 hypothetical protein EDE10_1043 [Bradyrhizobium sp. Y-H1]TCU76463.1 hypothetical protein EDE08_104640 [Bradyrhizobium sp. R2.2-H]